MTKAQLQLLEACPESMILVKAGEPVAWNSQACRMFDWTSKSAGVPQVWAVDGGLWNLEGDEVGLFESKVERALQGNPAKMRCRVVRQTGSMFDAEWKAVPVGDGSLLLQIRDISERMVYEQVLTAATIELGRPPWKACLPRGANCRCERAICNPVGWQNSPSGRTFQLGEHAGLAAVGCTQVCPFPSGAQGITNKAGPFTSKRRAPQTPPPIKRS